MSEHRGDQEYHDAVVSGDYTAMTMLASIESKRGLKIVQATAIGLFQGEMRYLTEIVGPRRVAEIMAAFSEIADANVSAPRIAEHLAKILADR